MIAWVRREGPATAVAIALSSWWWLTVAGSHPAQRFRRVQRLDPIGLLAPDWRFFAPLPSMNDYHLLYRARTPEGAVSPWRETGSISQRKALHAVWFPDRRHEKMLHDLAADLELALASRAASRVQATAAYRGLDARVRAAIRSEHERAPVGYQFALVKGAGFDEDAEPEYVMVSSYVPMTVGKQ